MFEKEVNVRDSFHSKQPGGGSDPNSFDCKETWYPIHYLEDLDKSKPTPFTVLGRNIVIWWDRLAQSWRGFEDQLFSFMMDEPYLHETDPKKTEI
jgi:phenylpropionate dioxygenase-like ring-hydroxylating dioxygenase large terminal subunit